MLSSADVQYLYVYENDCTSEIKGPFLTLYGIDLLSYDPIGQYYFNLLEIRGSFDSVTVEGVHM